MNDDDLDADLDAWLDDDEFDTDVVLDARLSDAPLTDLDERRVSALVARRVRLVDERARLTERAAERIAPIQAWLADRTAGIDSAVDWIDRSLEVFTRATLPQMRRRSLPLPSGVLKLTAPGAPSVDVIDEGEFVTWATDDQHPERDTLLRRTVAPDKAELKRRYRVGPRDDERSTDETDVFKAVGDDSEIVPGVRFTKPAADRFSVAPAAHTRHSNSTQGDN